MPPQDPLLHSGDKEEEQSSGNTSLSLNLDSDCNQHNDEDRTEGIFRSRPAGELERLESRRGMRESQGRVLVNRRRSFLVQFSEMKGPPQIAMLMALLAIGLGSIIGVVPAIMGDRFARLYHGYDGEAHCSSFSNNDNKPEACFLGGADAQAAASVANLVNNSLTFITASLTGSLSDEYGRKGKFVVISQLFFRF